MSVKTQEDVPMTQAEFSAERAQLVKELESLAESVWEISSTMYRHTEELGLSKWRRHAIKDIRGMLDFLERVRIMLISVVNEADISTATKPPAPPHSRRAAR